MLTIRGGAGSNDKWPPFRKGPMNGLKALDKNTFLGDESIMQAALCNDTGYRFLGDASRTSTLRCKLRIPTDLLLFISYKLRMVGL